METQRTLADKLDAAREALRRKATTGKGGELLLRLIVHLERELAALQADTKASEQRPTR